MFQCPWPFSVVSKEEATIKVVPSSTAPNNTGKKRKKEKPAGPDTAAAETRSCENNIESTQLGSDKCKSPNSKKLKLAEADKGKTTPEISEAETTETKKDDDKDGKTTKLRRLGSKEKDIINYLNENFPNSPQESPREEEKVASEPKVPSQVEDVEPAAQTASSEAAKQTSKAEEDARLFRAMPVVVRQPIKVPRHAANIFSSRARETEERSVSVKSPDSGSSDLECSGLSDLDDSDSELESLVSECSTMTAASETSSLASGGEGEGCGKKKRRGKKKKRKDRRKAHAGKCSKEQPRSSDLSLLVPDNTEDLEPAEEREVTNTEDEKVRVVQRSDGPSLKIRIKLGKPPAQTDNKLGRKNLKIKPVKKPVEEPSPMSLTPGEAEQEDKVSRMSTQSSVSNTSNMSLAASEPPAVMSVSPGEPLPACPDSPETDEEMSDLSTFQINWKNFYPLSPMSVGDDQEVAEREKSLKKKILKSKLPPPPPDPAPAPPSSTKTTNVLLPSSPETENVGFKEPASVTTPTRVRPTSHPSPGYSVPSPRMSEPSKCFSLPNLLSPMAPTPKSYHEETEDGENTKSEASKKKSSSLDSIIQNLAADKNEKSPDKPVPPVHVLPDGPYPRRRGRKSLAKKFQSDESIPENPNGSEQPSKPPDTPKNKGRGRPSKITSKAPESPIVTEVVSAEKSPEVPAPVKTLPKPKVIKLVNGLRLPPGLVPCAPPPGAKLVPCSPPTHLMKLNKNKTAKPSLFDLESTDIGKNRPTETPVDSPVEVESPRVKPAKTFSRATKKVPVTVATSLSIEATVQPQETSIDLKTLSLANFESEDPDFALVRKILQYGCNGPNSLFYR